MTFRTDTSQLCRCGARLSGNVRPTLPKVYRVGTEKAAVLNHRSTRSLSLPSLRLEIPVLFGFWPPPSEPVVLACARIGIGMPLWIVPTPFRLQPPATPRSILFEG